MLVSSLPVRTGGSFKSALAMVKHLQLMGHTVIVLAPSGLEKTIEEFTDTGAEFITVTGLKKRSPLPTTAGLKKIKQIAGERDVDIIHSMEFLGIGRTYPVAISLNKGFVFTEAGGNFKHHVPPVKIDTVLFSAEQMQTFTEAYRLQKDKLHLIRERIDTDLYKPTPVEPEFIEKFDLPQGRKIVGMAIRLEPQKAPWLKTIQQTAEIFCQKNIPASIIVAGEGALLNDLIKMANGINSNDKHAQVLKFIGPVFERKDITRFYNYADIVIGNGRGILEAMACRKPVAILGEKGQGSLVTRQNVEDVAFYNFSGRHFRYCRQPKETLQEQLAPLLNNPQKQNDLGRFSLDYIQEFMDARIGVQSLLEVYRKALENKNSTMTDFAAWYLKAVYYKMFSLAPEIKRRIMPGSFR